MKRLFYILSFLLLLFVASVQASSTRFYNIFAQCHVLSPDIVFNAGTNGTSYIISTNKTWVEFNVTGMLETTYYEYVINITNLSPDLDFQLKQEITSVIGIDRLANLTVYFHDGTTSKQVEITDGITTQFWGSWYSIAKLATIYLSLAVRVNSTSTSSAIALRLHIVKNGTTSPEYVQTINIKIT